MTTQTFSIGFPVSSTMYPSSRQSPGSGVGLDRGAAGGLTWIDAAMVTNVAGRGAAVPTGVDRTRAGVAEGSTVGVEATGAGVSERTTLNSAATTSTTAITAAPIC